MTSTTLEGTHQGNSDETRTKLMECAYQNMMSKPITNPVSNGRELMDSGRSANSTGIKK